MTLSLRSCNNPRCRAPSPFAGFSQIRPVAQLQSAGLLRKEHHETNPYYSIEQSHCCLQSRPSWPEGEVLSHTTCVIIKLLFRSATGHFEFNHKATVGKHGIRSRLVT